MLGKQRSVRIGNNVFLGWGATILSGTTIGDNVVIGAGSVVSGFIESNSVYAGNPAKKLMTITEYTKKVADHQVDDAFNIFFEYYKRNQCEPPKELFHEYFYLFTSASEALPLCFMKKIDETPIREQCLLFLNNNKPVFKDYETFCDYAMNRMKNNISMEKNI